MKLSELAKRPQLIEITIDDADIIEEFGEALTFHTWDRQPMAAFLRLASIDQNNVQSVIGAVRDLILDEKGQQILSDDVGLPTKVMMRVITRVVEDLGKL
jgi:hypothetical protein